MTISAYRASILDFVSDPGDHDAPASYRYFADGILLVQNGRVLACDHAELLSPTVPADVVIADWSGCLIIPGFVDTHIHYPQTDVIASGGSNLLDWLNNYTFPAERRFADIGYGREVASFFCDELMRNGTTSALVYGTVHRESAQAFFEVAEARGLRMIAGKALMDRNCPDYLQDTAATAYTESSALIEQWNGRARLNYAITPRFAVTSTEAQMESIARLACEHPDVHLHTHLAENVDEIALVAKLFPWSKSYLDVYDHYGLLRPRSIYAHCIHLNAADRTRMAESGASAAFCPTSNLYLGSGHFDIAATDKAAMQFSIATDVGGGTSFSMLRTMGEAYKVAQMRGQKLTPLRAFYLGTLGGARILDLQDHIGSLQPGKEADFTILNPAATPLMKRRAAACSTLTETLLMLMTLGDDRAVCETCIMGVPTLGTSAASAHK